MRRSTLLFVFIHGFKGDNDTFAGFPEHLQALITTARPHLNIRTLIYPQFETRGDLASTVSRFHSWLQSTVIDLEVSSKTPSPSVDPSVHTILVGHSMGGIVAADALLAILDDEPVGPQRIMFPHIAGVLAFDTPYLGLAPSMFAHGAEGKWRGAMAAYSTLGSVTGGLGGLWGAGQAKEAAVAEREQERRREGEKSAAGGWGWGTLAAVAGGAVALGGGAAAAYWKRDDIGAGLGWVSSHLEFVGALMKSEELRARVERISTTPGVGFANLFTSLGGQRVGTLSVFDGKERTFCSIPDQYAALRKKFYRCVNVKADDEVGAHVAMFRPATNPGYYEMADRAKGLVLLWVPEDAWMPVEDEPEAYRERKPARERERERERYDVYEKTPRRVSPEGISMPKPSRRATTHDVTSEYPPKMSRRDSEKPSKPDRRSTFDVAEHESDPWAEERRGSTYDAYDAPKPSRRSSTYEKLAKLTRRDSERSEREERSGGSSVGGRSEKSRSERGERGERGERERSERSEKPPKPSRRDSERSEKPRSERRSSTFDVYDKPEKPRRSSTFDVYEKPEKSERGERRSSTYDKPPKPSRRGSERTVELERRGSAQSSRVGTPEVERVRMERKGSGQSGSGRSRRDGRDGREGREVVDLEHNPWQ
ncbi:hypothetical protein EDC01DRAFT_724828 [Geopyxis carbonaria]|nr:hypothetical protein EDC01DRAFT_724828 [Geopyxis carbonaria]